METVRAERAIAKRASLQDAAKPSRRPLPERLPREVHTHTCRQYNRRVLVASYRPDPIGSVGMNSAIELSPCPPSLNDSQRPSTPQKGPSFLPGQASPEPVTTVRPAAVASNKWFLSQTSSQKIRIVRP